LNIFNLLLFEGLNGAGKTTTLEILTGGLDATSGEAFINGYNIKNNRLNAIRSLGYCPQFDHLPEFLTVRETLELFANLRNVNKLSIEGVVNEYLNIFKLYEFKNKLVQNLSGGNKRKVSSAIAFIGKPKTVILDEVIKNVNLKNRNSFFNFFLIKAYMWYGCSSKKIFVECNQKCKGHGNYYFANNS
jgi:ABC-type multidrug transport system ATPase subunit